MAVQTVKCRAARLVEDEVVRHIQPSADLSFAMPVPWLKRWTRKGGGGHMYRMRQNMIMIVVRLTRIAFHTDQNIFMTF